MDPDPTGPGLDDHRLAAELALEAGAVLSELRQEAGSGTDPWDLRDRGDRVSHELLMKRFGEHRPDDIVMSEEGADDRRRLDAERCWIVDPLDGTHDYPFLDSIEWAVHIAVVENQRPTAAAVSVPGLDQVFATDGEDQPGPRQRDQPLVISGRSSGFAAAAVAKELGGELTACGSSGVKAMLVVSGMVDVYVHASGLWEWDVCAPAAVAAAHGLVVTNIGGDEILYNKARPLVQGLVIARPEFAETTRIILDGLF